MPPGSGDVDVGAGRGGAAEGAAELGAGGGFYSAHAPRTISTDIVAVDWIDMVCDATRLPLAGSSVRNLIAIDGLAHFLPAEKRLDVALTYIFGIGHSVARKILDKTGVDGAIKAKKVGMVVAGLSSQVAAMAGMRLPIESHILQAFVTEGLKPCIDHVVSFGMGHFYISQSDKGGLVFGGDLDFYASYAQRGNLPMAEHVMEAAMSLMPVIGEARVLRSWGGIMDMTPDGSPIIDRTDTHGLFLNCGWCYGGFKAVPGSGFATAHLIATGEPHETAARFRLDRFETGRGLMDEEGTGAQHNLY